MTTQSYKLTEPETLCGLMESIVQLHHAYTRQELERVAVMLQALVQAGKPVAKELRYCISAMQEDLLPHLLKEENILFPYITALEQTPSTLPSSCFGSVANPIRMMEYEHATLDALLVKLRTLTGNYQATDDADTAQLYAVLAALDQDLVQHMYWENQVLFPRALQLEHAALA